MPIEFHVTNEAGEAGTVDDQFILQGLQQQGVPVQGISADGMTVTMQGGDGKPFEVSTSDVLKHNGWAIAGYNPIGADTENVQLGWATVIDKLTSDDERKDYLEAKLKRLGHESPTVIGSGTDWYSFNPATNQYIALTNKPGLDASDFTRVGMEAPRFVLGAVGAGLGGYGAGLPGMVAGGAGGGALGEAGVRGGAALLDEDFKRSTTFAGQAEEVGKAALTDAVAYGLTGGVGKAIPAAKALMQRGPVSTAAKAVGGTLEGAGGVTASAAKKVAETPLLADAASIFAPGGDVAAAGWLAQLPKAAVTSAAKLPGVLAESRLAQAVLPDTTRTAMSGLSQQLLKKTTTRPIAEEMAVRLGGAPVDRSLTAADVLRNLGAKGDIAAARSKLSKEGLGSFDELLSLDRTKEVLMRDYGVAEAEAEKLAELAVREAVDTSKLAAGGPMTRAGEAVGRTIDTLSNVGRGVERGFSHVVKGGLRGVQGAGTVAKGVGSTLRHVGTLGQPLEAGMYGRAGGDYLRAKYEERLRQKALRDILKTRNQQWAGVNDGVRDHEV